LEDSTPGAASGARSIEPAIRRIAEASRARGAEMELKYECRYPPTINSVRETELAATAAASPVGDNKVKRDLREGIFHRCINQDRRLLLINDRISRYPKRV
jgi:metal-dependent amidase/aminoacylase/carboxypeptidase family protein